MKDTGNKIESKTGARSWSKWDTALKKVMDVGGRSWFFSTTDKVWNGWTWKDWEENSAAGEWVEFLNCTSAVDV